MTHEEIIMEQAAAEVAAAFKVYRLLGMSFTSRSQDCIDKYISDDDPEETSHTAKTETRQRNRGDRRRAEKLRKKRYEKIYNHPSHNDAIKRVVHGEKETYIKGGDQYAWKKAWRNINNNARRREGKRLCADITEREIDFSSREIDLTPERETVPETFMDMYFIIYDHCPNYDYVIDRDVVVGYDKAKEAYERIVSKLKDDEYVGLYTVRVSENGILCTNDLVMETDSEEE